MEHDTENYEVIGRKYDLLIQDVNSTRARQNVGEILFILFVCFLGIIGNTAACAYYVKILKRSMWTKLMTVLSCNDLCASMVFLGTISFAVRNINYPSITLCQSLSAIGHALGKASFLLLLLITIDRYLQVCLLKRPKLKKFIYTIVGIYCYSFGSVIRYVWILNKRPINVTVGNITLKAYECALIKGNLHGVIMRSLDISLIVLFLLCSSVLYLKMFWRIRTFAQRVQLRSMSSVTSISTTSLANVNQIRSKSINEVTNFTIQASDTIDRNAKKADKYRSVQIMLTKMMFYVTFISLVSYTPYFVLMITTKVGTTYDVPLWQKVLFRAYMLNTSINPYIVGYFSKEFRTFITNIVCGVCRRNA